MKSIATLLLLFTTTIALSQKVETITIPDGVVYHYGSAKLVEKAKKAIRDNLSDNPDFSIVQKITIIGPELWKRYKDNQKIQQIEKGNVSFHVDDLVLEGKMGQDIDDSKIIWDEFRKEVGKDYIIRKANEWELRYYWSVISFDIDEPLLIVETKNHNYILNLLKDDLTLMWLDEAPAQPLRKMVKYQDGKEVDSISKGIRETKLEKVVLLNSNDEVEQNTTVEDISALMSKTNAIFDELFKTSTKSGKIMVEFELQKKENKITFAVRDDLDLDIMKEFEKRVNNEKYPHSKSIPIKIQLIYKVNAYNDTE